MMCCNLLWFLKLSMSICLLCYLQNVDAELQLATEAFLDGEGCVIDMEKKEVELTRS